MLTDEQRADGWIEHDVCWFDCVSSVDGQPFTVGTRYEVLRYEQGWPILMTDGPRCAPMPKSGSKFKAYRLEKPDAQ